MWNEEEDRIFWSQPGNLNSPRSLYGFQDNGFTFVAEYIVKHRYIAYTPNNHLLSKINFKEVSVES